MLSLRRAPRNGRWLLPQPPAYRSVLNSWGSRKRCVKVRYHKHQLKCMVVFIFNACAHIYCAYVYIYIYTYIYIHIYMYIYIYLCIGVYIGCIHACKQAHMHTCRHACLHSCKHACVHTCIHTYKRKYTCTYIYI